eukprot:8758397-Ditylum_brightwellii.AAC.1
MVLLGKRLTLNTHVNPKTFISSVRLTMIQDSILSKVPISEFMASLNLSASGPFMAYVKVGLLLVLDLAAKQRGLIPLSSKVET